MAHKLKFRGSKALKRGDIPEHIKEVIFNYWYDHELPPNVLHEGLTHITFGAQYNCVININVLPNSLTHLEFGYCYNQKIDVGALPDSLTHLTFSYCYNQTIYQKVLPDTLTHLTFGVKYNKNLDNALRTCNRLTHLVLGGDYDQPIHFLPDSLLHITLGYKFQKPPIINGKSVLPKNLKEIYFNNSNIIINYAAFSSLNDNINVYIFDKWGHIRNNYVRMYNNISDHINILKLIDMILPMPIAQEIIPNVFENII